MTDIFERLRGKAADHTVTTVLGTVVKFYLAEAPPIVVKEVLVRAPALIITPCFPALLSHDAAAPRCWPSRARRTCT